MISDEVQMLINRMKSNPEEFAVDQIGLGDNIIRETRKWTLLMSNIVNDKPSLYILFTEEEVKALREAVSEILRPEALATIVKSIVGGASTPEEMHHQMEMEYTHIPSANKLEKLQEARVQLIKQYLESQSQE